MRELSKGFAGLVLSVVFVFGASILLESSAWARAGGGGSLGSRGGRSFSPPQMPSSPSQRSPGIGTPGRNAYPGSQGQQPGGFFSRSPFMQGLAGGLAGGLIGSLLFGGMGHASPGGAGAGGIGFLDIAILGLLLYLGYRFFRKRREQKAFATAQYAGAGSAPSDGGPGFQEAGYPHPSEELQEPSSGYGELERGLDQIRRMDPGFDEERFRETAQDLFFRVQAGWTNRSLHGIEGIVTDQMAGVFGNQFELMTQKGVVNRLENIAIRKVELSEAWQETGKEYITVLYTANLLDYTVDAATGAVVDGDKLSPVKFQEFWTFSRDIGSQQWRLSAIDQMKP